MKLDIERKSRPAKRPQDNSAGGEEPTTVEYSTPKVKGDAPDRFWASVEPYCADISETEIRLLQDGLRNVRNATCIYIQYNIKHVHVLYACIVEPLNKGRLWTRANVLYSEAVMNLSSKC